MSRPVFVTATGTGVGKTQVACLLVGELRRRGRHVGVLKPVATGFDDDDPLAGDPARLALAAGYDPLSAIPMISPWCYAAALPPDMAARREDDRIDYGQVLIFCERTIRIVPDWLIIDGAGGVMTPLAEGRVNRDLIHDLGRHRDMPVLLVTGCNTDTVSHTMTAIEALAQISVVPAAVIASRWPDELFPSDEIVDSLASYWVDGPVVPFPRQTDDSEWTGALAPVLDVLAPKPADD